MLRNKPLKKIMCAALAGVSVFASVAMFSSCTTSHPEVEMKLSFNDKSYTLQYKLYRKIAPSTVQHFLCLLYTSLGCLQSSISKFVYVLDSIAKAKETANN